MIRKQGKTKEEGNPGLDISSLIDVSFLLLIYFLITSTLDPREGDIGLTMPGDFSVNPIAVPTIDVPLIVGDSAGVVSFESEVIESNSASRILPRLDDRLRTYVEAYRIVPSNGDPSVKIDVDDSVSTQRFVDVMNCLAGAGIENVMLVDFARE